MAAEEENQNHLIGMVWLNMQPLLPFLSVLKQAHSAEWANPAKHRVEDR